MKINRVQMSVLDSVKRQTNFDEVACGFTLEESKAEASRCLDCKKPKCVDACPVHVDIPGFIKEILNDDLDKAYFKLYQDNILPAICGRVCPQEKQCEGSCILGIKGESVSIGALERYLGDYALEKNLSINKRIENNGFKVAVIGSGPAGLSNAASMRRLGYEVTVFEALHEYGGVLQYGIPDFRLPKNIVEREISKLKDMGVTFEKNVLVGKSITIDQLKSNYNFKAVFIGSGAGLPSSLNIPGENYSGVYYANEFLTRVNLMKSKDFPTSPTPIKTGDNVAVVGGGNVAMDAARTAKRLGAKNVFILYRRDMNSLPARLEEIHHAIEEDIDFRLLLNPIKFIGDNYRVSKVECEIMELGEEDSSGRRRPVSTGNVTTFDIDSCIISIGQKSNPIIKKATPDMLTDKWGRIVVEDYQTSIPGVFAGGDVVSGAATVILAMGAGKDASFYMDKFIKETYRV